MLGNIRPDRDSNEAASIWLYWIPVYGRGKEQLCIATLV
jgi:hypothetical protein